MFLAKAPEADHGRRRARPANNMAFLRRNNNAKPDYTALQVQTSTSTLPIPIVWGQNRLAPNLIWYANFKAVPGGSGKGVGGKGGLSGAAPGLRQPITYTPPTSSWRSAKGRLRPWVRL